jgi:hypothetical protein
MQSEAEAKRQTRIGSAAITAILGLNPWKTPLAQWRYMRGLEPEVVMNNDMRMGVLLEPYIGKLFQERNPNLLVEPGQYYKYKGSEVMTASPDFLVSVPGRDSKVPLEVKNVGRGRRGSWMGDHDVPEGVYVQVQWQAGVMEAPWCFAAALCGNTPADYVEKNFAFDPIFFATALEAAERFMALVEADIPPEAQSEDYRPLVKLQREAKQVMIEGMETVMTTISNAEVEKKRYAAEVKKWEGIIEEAKAKILLKMGDANKAVIDNRWFVEVKSSPREGYTVQPTTVNSFKVKTIEE